MKVAVAVAVLCLGAAPAVAQDLRVGGFALVQPQWTEARKEPLDPRDAFDLTGSSVEVAGVLDAKWRGFSVRARATESGRTDEGDWPRIDNVKILELQWTGPVGDHLTASVGKRILSWDPGYSAQPLGFFQSETVLSDLTDEAGRDQGVPLAALTWLGAGWSATGAISDDFGEQPDGRRRGLKQWAVRLTRQIGAADTAVVVQQPEGAAPGVGGSISTALGDYVSLHASGFFAAHRLAVAPTLVVGDPSFLDRPVAPLSVSRSRTTAAQALVGGVLTPMRGLTLVSEYVYNGQGLSDSEWNGFVRMVRTQRGLLSTAQGTGIAALAAARLGLDGQALASGNLRRNYSFVSASYDVGRWTFGQSALMDLTDASATVISSVAFRPDHAWSYTAVLQLFEGGSNSEFGIIPIGLQGYLRVRRAF